VTALQRIPRGWWTVLLGTASFVAFGLMFLVSSPGGGSMLALEVGILLVALVGGALAQRWIDTMALGLGLAAAMETQAIIQSLPPDVPDDLPWLMLGVVWVPALGLTALASIAFALGPRLDRKRPAATAPTSRIPRLGCLGRLLGGIVVAVALGSIFVLRTSYQTTPST
jgi:hypothetical protein